MASSNVEKAAEVPAITHNHVAYRVIELLPLDATGHVTACGYTEDEPTCGCYSLPGRIAQALADAGLLAEGEPETRVEYGVRHEDWVDTGGFESVDDARIDAANAWGTAVQRTVTTYRSEWTEVADDGH